MLLSYFESIVIAVYAEDMMGAPIDTCNIEESDIVSTENVERVFVHLESISA